MLVALALAGGVAIAAGLVLGPRVQEAPTLLSLVEPTCRRCRHTLSVGLQLKCVEEGGEAETYSAISTEEACSRVGGNWREVYHSPKELEQVEIAHVCETRVQSKGYLPGCQPDSLVPTRPAAGGAAAASPSPSSPEAAAAAATPRCMMARRWQDTGGMTGRWVEEAGRLEVLFHASTPEQCARAGGVSGEAFQSRLSRHRPGQAQTASRDWVCQAAVPSRGVVPRCEDVWQE
ncbi:MAG TPA: hypothetical protein VGK67_25735 [Myxococcales bacterium]